jgi:hypothetical protein
MVEVIHHAPAVFLSFVSAEAIVLQYDRVVVVAQELEVNLKVLQE